MTKEIDTQSIDIEKIDVEITGSIVARYSERSSDFRVSGILQLTNRATSGALKFETGEFPLRIGWRLLRGKEFLREGRIPFRSGSLEPGARARVPVAIGLGYYEPGTYTMLITIVRERKFWLNQRKESMAFRAPLQLDNVLSPFESGYWTSTGDIYAEDAQNNKVRRSFFDMLAEIDFSGHFRDALTRSATYKPLSSAELRIANALARPSDFKCGKEALPEIVKFLYCTRALFDPSAPYPDGKISPDALTKLVKSNRSLQEFIIRTSPLLRMPVLPREQVPPWVLGYRLSNLALHYLSERPVPMALRDRHELYLWFTNNIVIPDRIALDLVGDSIVSFLQTDVISGSSVRLSRYFRSVYERGGYAQHYKNYADPAIPFSLDMFLIHSANAHMKPLFGVDVKKFWSGPASRRSGGPTRFEVAVWTYTPSELSPFEVDDPFEDRRIVDLFAQHPLRASPVMANLFTPLESGGERAGRALKPADPKTSQGKGKVCIIGLRRTETGLGQNFRMFEEALTRSGRLACAVDCEVSDLNVEYFADDWDTTIFVINAENLPRAYLDCMGKGLVRGKVIGFFLWELETLNPLQHTGIECVDEIMVPSEFVGNVYRQATDKPVTNVGKFFFRDGQYEDAMYTGEMNPVGVDTFAFLTAFDAHSGIVRKNPLAVVRAFIKAFPAEAGENVSLILKTTELLADHWGDRDGQMEAILAIAESDPRVRIIADRMPFTDYIGLIKSADCIVSASYSEGFGYLVAYGMWFGTPVVTNNYGGPRDFCTSETSFLAEWSKKPVDLREFIPRVQGATWAEVNIDSLAEQMRTVFDQPALAKRKAAAGRASIRARYTLDAFSTRLEAALDGSRR